MTTADTNLPPVATTRDTAAAAPAPSGLVQRVGVLLTVENLLYIGIAVLSVLLHMYDLGNRALHHDETLHAAYSWRIYQGGGYIHDPLLHGPFLYYFGALIYWLFGDNDFTARFGYALFGTVLVLLPWFVRRELGRVGALAASVYLLISPVFLYVGRFARHDIYSMVFEMLVFVAVVRYATSRKAVWLFTGVAAFAFMYVNQETSYLFLLIMGTPIIMLLLWQVFRPGIALIGGLGVALALLVFVLPGTAIVDGGHTAERDPATGAMVIDQPGPVFGWAPLETEDNAYALQIRNRPDNLNGQPLYVNFVGYLGEVGRFFAHPAILLGTGLTMLVSALLLWAIWLRRASDGTTQWQRAAAADDTIVPVFASLWGQRGQRLLLAAGIFLVIYALFFTAFLTNIIGVVSGTTGSLLYWLAQHNVERGGQPGYYYLVLLAVYEPLAVLWALAGGGIIVARLVHLRRSGGSLVPLLLPFLLLWWSITALGIYSWAGEKMPWLTVHVLLPQILLGAWAFQQVMHTTFAGTHWQQQRGSLLLFGGLFALIVLFGYTQITRFINATGTPDSTSMSAGLVLLLTLILLVLLIVGTGMLLDWRRALGWTALCLTLLLAFYTVRNTWRLNYELGDVPREVLVYTQTSPDVMNVVRGLEGISVLQTAGLDMPIIYDNETVWQWYFRNWTDARGGGVPDGAPPAEDVQAIVMLEENYRRLPEDYAAGFVVQTYPLRWWFPQGTTYELPPDWQTAPPENLPLLGQALRVPFSDQTIVGLWDYLFHRDPGAPLGSTNFVLLIRPEIADQVSPGLGSPATP